MTGLLRRSFWCALHFCILNRYEARSKNVFCKQTADLCNKNFFLLERKLPSKPALSNASFGVLEVKKCCVPSELRDFFYIQTLLYTYSRDPKTLSKGKIETLTCNI